MKILTLPDPALHEVCENIIVPVIEEESYDEMIRDMVFLMTDARGVGLAAPQVGVPKRLIIIDPEQQSTPLIMLNPILNGIGADMEWAREGCLSCPGVIRRILRRKAINLYWRDRKGAPHERRFDGWAARVVQHELDHLQGIVIATHGRNEKKKKGRRR